ncbi:hypothetical protein Leryth_016129 [Lithospermum erythrorhizon]|nr:hypothetical protein Leryth_016129 [Lithospermum erythrorhizon]
MFSGSLSCQLGDDELQLSPVNAKFMLPSHVVQSFLEFACPYHKQINDLTNDCATTMFSYITLHGNYPPGIFANICTAIRMAFHATVNPHHHRLRLIQKLAQHLISLHNNLLDVSSSTALMFQGELSSCSPVETCTENTDEGDCIRFDAKQKHLRKDTQRSKTIPISLRAH